MSRIEDIRIFYDLLERLGRPVQLGDLSSLRLPNRGVYFFFEEGELRSTSGEGHRVVRVGTHGLQEGTRSKLKGRLAQHRGNIRDGGGNHRGSIFRLLLGTALGKRCPTSWSGSWGRGSSATSGIRDTERNLEIGVSLHIRKMRFVWVVIDDEPGPKSKRGYIERNAIGLLSNWGRSTRDVIDIASDEWLGRDCNRDKVRQSGLWNQDWVDEPYNPDFIETLERSAMPKIL